MWSAPDCVEDDGFQGTCGHACEVAGRESRPEGLHALMIGDSAAAVGAKKTHRAEGRRHGRRGGVLLLRRLLERLELLRPGGEGDEARHGRPRRNQHGRARRACRRAVSGRRSGQKHRLRLLDDRPQLLRRGSVERAGDERRLEAGPRGHVAMGGHNGRYLMGPVE